MIDFKGPARTHKIEGEITRNSNVSNGNKSFVEDRGFVFRLCFGKNLRVNACRTCDAATQCAEAGI